MKNNAFVIEVDPDLKDLIPGYLEKRKAEVPALRQALRAGDFEILRQAGHRLKGNAGGYGFDRMGDIGGRIETEAKMKNQKEIEDALVELENYLTHVKVVFSIAP